MAQYVHELAMSLPEGADKAITTGLRQAIGNAADYVAQPLSANNGMLLKSVICVAQALTAGVVCVGIICAGTFAYTSVRYHLTSGPELQFKGKEPPTMPYWLPWIGSGLSMVSDPHKFYEHTLSKRPEKGPVTMRLGPISMYLIMGADNIQAIFRHSRLLSFEFMQLRIAHKVKGLPMSDVRKLNLDTSGTGAIALSEQTGDERIWHKLHSIYLSNLTEKSAVEFLSAKFVSEFAKQLESAPHVSTTTGLYTFLKHYQFNASTITLVGPNILGHGNGAAEFSHTFWEYDAAFMTLLQGLPRFICRQGWAARDRTLEATKEWLRQATRAEKSNADLDWDQNFGHRLVRERNATLEKYGVSFEGRAAMHMGLIWAINANAIPMTAYMLIEMVRDPELLRRVRAEVQAAKIFGPKQDGESVLPDKIDMDALSNLPLLNSIYKECLRLRSSIPISRRLRQDVEIDGYTLKKDNFILAPSWVSHMDESVWRFKPNGPGVEEFWAERFLYMDATKTKVKLGDYCPFGGGTVICPGRFFAKNEILAAVVMVAMRFDLEFQRYSMPDGVSPSDRGPGMEKAECRGIVSLDRDVVVKMRRRALYALLEPGR